ncbi:hypothetical protein [Rhizobium rhizogenes]|uniref:hypothetical protein n=1 Tax=Rhizobium rhizogenes TaxID=359 RepID=UPI001574CB2D|nr:hypothetical protein [Rhizobium rhizogenes]NTF96113.1 hypothetical protein [Rhizobium rhizogenes]
MIASGFEQSPDNGEARLQPKTQTVWNSILHQEIFATEPQPIQPKKIKTLVLKCNYVTSFHSISKQRDRGEQAEEQNVLIGELAKLGKLVQAHIRDLWPRPRSTLTGVTAVDHATVLRAEG